MKWHRWHIIIVLITMFFLQGCKQVDINVESKIAAPKLSESPLQGTWKVDKYVSLDNSISTKDNKKYLGMTAAFDKSIAVLGTEACDSPAYKIKNISSEQYFLYKYKANALQFGIKEENINVITISSNRQLFRDFIRVNDNSLLVYENQGFLYLSKVSDKVEPSISHINSADDPNKNENSAVKPNSLLKSGVFIGLRTPGATNNAGSSYRTLWIASSNRAIKPIYEMKQLFVPRKTGFWEIDYWSQKMSDISKGTLYAHSVVDDNLNYDKNSNNLLEETGKRDILYVSNDYIATEYRYTDPSTSKEKAKYQILPMDNIRTGTGINISDIAGQDALNALIKSGQTYTMSLDKGSADALQKDPEGDNFTLSRRNGQWIVKGRLNYLSPTAAKLSEDFDVYLLPPQKLVSYDVLKLPWNYIKEKVPEALDAYTSPNKDLALIITKNSIDIYTIDKEKLSEKPVQSIELHKGEAVVMAEWAIGTYVEKWDDVIKPRASELVNNNKR